MGIKKPLPSPVRKSNKSIIRNMMATSRIGSATPWPTVSEAHEVNFKEKSNHEEDGESWEILSGEEPGSESHLSTTKGALKHCESSPNFGSIYFEDEDESFIEIDPESDLKSVSTALTDMTHVVIDNPSSSPVAPVGGGMVKVHRVPSFKDAILLNAEEIRKEQLKKMLNAQQHRNSMKKMKRPITKPKYVVKEFRRCSQSTPDLTKMAKVVEDEDYYDDNNQTFGETDAFDFYARKSLGASARKNGLKLRPDEAKRKEFIVFKKNAQRMQSHKR